jgi:hypothetical protein
MAVTTPLLLTALLLVTGCFWMGLPPLALAQTGPTQTPPPLLLALAAAAAAVVMMQWVLLAARPLVAHCA